MLFVTPLNPANKVDESSRISANLYIKSFIYYVSNNFPKNQHLLPPDTHRYACISK